MNWVYRCSVCDQAFTPNRLQCGHAAVGRKVCCSGACRKVLAKERTKACWKVKGKAYNAASYQRRKLLRLKSLDRPVCGL